MKRTDFFKSLKAKGVDPSLGVLRSIVAADLHAAMVSANLNQSKLASKLGWSRARVSQVFSGDENSRKLPMLAALNSTLHFDARSPPARFNRGKLIPIYYLKHSEKNIRVSFERADYKINYCSNSSYFVLYSYYACLASN